MSGSAGISVLEESVFYSYEESSRKILRGEDYGAYFREKHNQMLGVIAHGAPQFANWRKALRESGIELKPLPIFSDPSRSDGKSHRIEIESPKGVTALNVEFVEKPTVAQLETFKKISREVDFEKLVKAWEAAKSPKAQSSDYIKGLMEVRPFPKFTLAMAVTADVRSDLEPQLRKELKGRIDSIAGRVSSGFDEMVNTGQMWINPKTLLSYEEKFGKLPSEEDLRNPARSNFNFFGPLFDGNGGRTSSSIGLAKVSMLFLPSTKKWEEDSTYGSNRGQFENWFTSIVRDPEEIDREIKQTFESYFVPGGLGVEYASVNREARDSIETLLKKPWLQKSTTAPYLKKLKAWCLDRNLNIELRKPAMEMLMWTDSNEAWEVLTEMLGQHLYEGGSEGTTPILMQKAASIAYGAVRVSGPVTPEVKQMRLKANQALDLLIVAHRRSDLTDGDRTWTDISLRTYQNHVYSALEEIVSEKQKYDKAYLLEQKALIDKVIGPKSK